MSEEKTQRLVLSIMDFLNGAISDGAVKNDDKEGLEVAVQCIAEAFGVDPSNKTQIERLSIKPATLATIFDVYIKTREKASVSASPQQAAPSSQAKADAERLKQAGNQQMTAKSYDAAIQSYTQAIELDGTNPVFYSNRAAAYSSKGEQHSAIADAEKAIEIDAKFAKAYHRLGYAHFSLGQFEAAQSAFRGGLDLDPTNLAMKTGLENAKAQAGQDDHPAAPTGASAGANPGSPNLDDLMRGMGGAAGAGAGAGAGGGAGGMPDLSSMMNNPMMRQAAESLMANGGMERLMQNPAVANMMNRVNSGGGMPSMAELMSDPALREAAQSFMGSGPR